MKLGVITDGISRDFGHALAVMDEFGLEHAELQYLWDKEVGDLDADERRRALELVKRHGKKSPASRATSSLACPCQPGLAMSCTRGTWPGSGAASRWRTSSTVRWSES